VQQPPTVTIFLIAVDLTPSGDLTTDYWLLTTLSAFKSPYYLLLKKDAHRRLFYFLNCFLSLCSFERIAFLSLSEAGVTSRELYLPQGEWKNIFSGETVNGGKYISVDAPIDVIPVFEKM